MYLWKRNEVRCRTGRGFTLIELLVVVAVISILAAILFPVFARARENARRSSCQSNLKQIGLAMMQYAQDHDERLTPGYIDFGVTGAYILPNGKPSSSTAMLWFHMLYPYMKNIQIMNCPSESTRVWTDGTYTGSIPYGLNYIRPTACTPAAQCGETMAPTKAAGLSLAAIEDTAGTVLVIDSKYYLLQFDHAQTAAEILSSSNPSGVGACRYSAPVNYAGCVSARHLGTANALFVDGHVKAMKPEVLVGNETVESWRYWTTNLD